MEQKQEEAKEREEKGSKGDYDIKQYYKPSAFLSYLDFLTKNSIYAFNKSAFELNIKNLQYITKIPYKTQQLHMMNRKGLRTLAYELYHKRHMIDNKEVLPVSSTTIENKIVSYGELYDRIEALFPEKSIMITNMPIDHIEFKRSPNKNIFALYEKLSPYNLVNIMDKSISEGKYVCDPRYNDRELMKTYPEHASKVEFINRVCEILHESIYYDFLVSFIPQPHKLLYEAVNGEVQKNNGKELGEIAHYMNEHKENFSYGAFGRFLYELYK